MTQALQNHTHSPLIGLIFEENGHEVVRYFTEEKAADAAVSESVTQKALGVILIGMRRSSRLAASATRVSPPIKL
jgi:hypothetical protein